LETDLAGKNQKGLAAKNQRQVMQKNQLGTRISEGTCTEIKHHKTQKSPSFSSKLAAQYFLDREQTGIKSLSETQKFALLKLNKVYIESRRSPSFLPHLIIRIKTSS
jgi:hypothetical protein